MYDTDFNQDLDSLKIPPNNIEAEQSVIGGLMLDPKAWDRMSDKVSEKDFYRQDHRLIFGAITELVEENISPDVITLSEYLQGKGELENAGGLAYLGTLAKDTPSAANIAAYCNIVREKSLLRQVISVVGEVSDDAFSSGYTSQQVLDNAEKKILSIAEGVSSEEAFTPIKDALKHTLARIEELSLSESAITGEATGYTELDNMLSGLNKGDLVIVAGRPSMGKTTLAMNIAEHVAVKGEKTVAVFSMEMPTEQLTMRLFASMGRVPLGDIRSGKINENDWARVAGSVKSLSKSSLHMDDSGNQTPNQIRAKCRRLARDSKDGLGLIVIDYLQLMTTEGSSENRTNEVTKISRQLKAIAKEMDCPVIALSQLNRSLEKRTDKRPIMSDLRESGAIEQDADVIAFVYRDEVYNEESPDKGTAEVIIAKQRNGAIGTVKLAFIGKYTRFDNYSPDDYYNHPK